MSHAKTAEPTKMPFGLWARVNSLNHVFDGGPDPHEKGQFWGVQHAPTCLMTLWHQLCKNGWTNQDTVWVTDSDGPKESCIRWGSVLSCLWRWCIVAKQLDGLRWNFACR